MKYLDPHEGIGPSAARLDPPRPSANPPRPSANPRKDSARLVLNDFDLTADYEDLNNYQVEAWPSTR